MRKSDYDARYRWQSIAIDEIKEILLVTPDFLSPRIHVARFARIQASHGSLSLKVFFSPLPHCGAYS